MLTCPNGKGLDKCTSKKMTKACDYGRQVQYSNVCMYLFKPCYLAISIDVHFSCSFLFSCFIESFCIFLFHTGPYFFSMDYLISYLSIMEQNFAFASLCRSYLKIGVVIPAEPLGGKLHLLRTTGQRGCGQKKMLE